MPNEAATGCKYCFTVSEHGNFFLPRCFITVNFIKTLWHGNKHQCVEGLRLILVKVEQYRTSSCLAYLKRTLAPRIITMCTVRLQYEQPWIIFRKSLTHPEPSMLSGLYSFSARRECLFPHLQIKQSGYSYLLHLLKSAFCEILTPFSC